MSLDTKTSPGRSPARFGKAFTSEEAAQGYQAGVTLALFLCNSDKTPATKNGFKDASAEPSAVCRILRQVNRAPDRWLAGAKVPDGVVVVDVDPRHGGDESLAVLVQTYGSLPTTRTARTRSGGRHIWFACAGPLQQDQRGRLLGAGLDTRVAGKGYVIVPPSAGYRWLVEGAPAPAPAWLIKKLRPAPEAVHRVPIELPTGTHRRARYVDAALRAEFERVRTCPVGVGQRNVTLHRSACRLGQLVGAGLLEDWRAAQTLLAATSLPGREARSTIISGLNWGIANPRRVPS